jgi:hypothetical protein
MLSMSLRTVAPAVLITLLCAFACAQSDKASFKDLVAQAPDLIRLQDEFEQTVPPGVSIEAREVYRKGTSGKDLEVRYNVIVKGVPLGTTLRQVQFPVNTDKAVPGINGITLNSDGLMICAGRTPSQCHNGDKLDSPVVFVQQNLLKGEPRRSVFLAPDLRIPISIVPDPVQSEDGGCKLSAIRLSAKFELSRIEGSGFSPNSDIHLRFSDSESAGVSLISSDGAFAPAHGGDTIVAVKSDNRGAIQTETLFNTLKNPSGLETVEVADPRCSPKISYKWGVF